jgi:hypothetical protein
MSKKSSKSKEKLEKAEKELGKKAEKLEKAEKKSRRKREPKLEPEVIEIEEIEPESETETEGEDVIDIRPARRERPEPHFEELNPEPQPTQILDNDDYDTIYNIKESLISAGVPVGAEKKFLVSKKESSNKYSYQKTYYNDMPDMEVIGNELRGGEFMVSVHAEINGKKQIVKNYYFTVSVDMFPPLSKQANNPVAPAQAIPADNSLMVEYMRQSNERFEKLLEKLAGGNSTKDMIESLVLLKKLAPDAPQSINTSELMKMQGEMFKEGLKYAKELNENSGKEDIGDVLLNMAKDVSEKIDWTALTGGKRAPVSLPDGSNQAVPVPPQPAPNKAKAVEVLNDFFNDVIIGFESELEVNPYIFAEKVKKIARYKVIDNFVGQLSDDIIFNTLSSAPEMKKRLDMPEFYQYVKSIIDIIRRFDILELNDDGDVIEKQPEPKQPVVPEVKNDNSAEPAPVGDTVAKPAEKEKPEV